MASQYVYCSRCKKKSATHLKLFDALYNFSKMSVDDCPACGIPQELHVNLDFQLGAGDGDFRVVFRQSCGETGVLARRKKGRGDLLSFSRGARDQSGKQALYLDAVLACHG